MDRLERIKKMADDNKPLYDSDRDWLIAEVNRLTVKQEALPDGKVYSRRQLEDKLAAVEKERDAWKGWREYWFQQTQDEITQKKNLESELTTLKEKGLKQCAELAKAQRECEQLKEELDQVRREKDWDMMGEDL